MAPEVISLLSSPEIIPPATLPPGRAKARSDIVLPSSRAFECTPQNATDLNSRLADSGQLAAASCVSTTQANKPSHDVVFLSDDFDNTDLSSSRRSNHDAEPFAQTGLTANITRPKPKRPSDDFMFLSDDFDTTDVSLPKEGHGRKTKEQRVLKTHDVGTQRRERRLETLIAPFSSPLQPAEARPRTAPRANTVSDAIDFSSPGRLVTGCAAKRQNIIDYDPFASSSQLGKVNQPPIMTGKSWDLSDDPFASSPQVRGKSQSAESHLMQEISKDPFASSPRCDRDITEPRQTPSFNILGKGANRPQAPSPKRPVAWDPISSSAPEAATRSDPFGSPPRSGKPKMVAVIDLSDSEAETGALRQGNSSDDDFPDLNDIDTASTRTRTLTRTTSAVEPRRKAKPKTSKALAAKKAVDGRPREKEDRAAAREVEKERKRREKEQAKAEKAREKERTAALAEVNKVRTDKKISTPEMIADLPSTLAETVVLQVETLLKDLNVQHTLWESPIGNVVKWRRKVSSQYNEELGHWEPIPMRIESEKHALVLVPAAEFIDLVLGSDGVDLDAHVMRMQRHFEQHTLIYLIEGLATWQRKNRAVRNRAFTSAVRSGLDEEPPPSSQAAAPARRRNNSNNKNSRPQPTYVDEDVVEDALLRLQVAHGALIHHTAAAVETARWIAIFTQHISTVPYRRQRDAAGAAAAFCMEAGQVRTGDGAGDTYVRMLQEVARVTAPIAYGVAGEFGTVAGLVRGLEREGPLRLEAVRKSANKDGAVSERTIGQAVSRRLYKVFTSRDEGSTDV